jgi:protein-tyrosine-phosphatase
MAAAWLRHFADERVEVYSAGSEPAARVNPVAVEAMREVGLDIAAEKPKILTTDSVEQADVVITMGCGDTCPYFPGKRYIDWDLPDPKGRPVDEVRRTRDEIARRVKDLVAELDGS